MSDEAGNAYTLFINTASPEGSLIRLSGQGVEHSREIKGRISAQKVIGVLEELLTSEEIQISRITEVRISAGPGSYTGLRVGAAVGRAIAMLLSVKLNGQNPLENPRIEYGD